MHGIEINKNVEKQKAIGKQPYLILEDFMKKITVCDKCLTASCWQGLFMCDDSKFAGTVEKTIDELKELNLEHSSYWKTDRQLAEQN